MNDKSFDPWGGRVIRYTIRKDEISGFLAELNAMQEEMIEVAVAIEEKKGFPKVQELLANIRG